MTGPTIKEIESQSQPLNDRRAPGSSIPPSLANPVTPAVYHRAEEGTLHLFLTY